MANDLAPGQEVAPAQSRGVAAAFQADLDAYTPNLHQALPAHVSVEKFKRVLITAVSSNPDLLYANRRTLFTAAVKCASDGLLPDGREAALVVYNTKVKQRDPQTGLDREVYIDSVQYMPMVAGIRKRMRNTGDVLSADAHVVYEKDHFRYKLGDDGFIDHEPAGLSDDPGKPLGAYAIIKLQSGEVLRDVMRLADIEKTRSVSRAKNGPMWTKWWEEAARKTVLRRCSKAAPQSAEMESLLSRDEEEPAMVPAFDALPDREPEPVRPAIEAPVEHDETPVYTVVDLDGVEHEFRDATTAETALVRVLEEAAKQGLERLDGVWESNEPSTEGWPPHIEIAARGIYHEKRSLLIAPKSHPAPPAVEKPAAAPIAPQAAPHSPAAPQADTLPFPGSAAAAPATPADSLAIPAPLRSGKPDWRTWSVALFMPKVRKAADSTDLAFLLGDNEENLTKARAALPKEEAEALDATIEQRWKEIG